MSSSNTNSKCIDPADFASRRFPNLSTNPTSNQRSKDAAESNTVSMIGIREVEELFKHELCGQVRLHKSFLKEFLTTDENAQEDVRGRIVPELGTESGTMSLIGLIDGYWTVGHQVALQRNEKEAYGPLAAMLNLIGRAVYDCYKGRYPDDQFRQQYHPFMDHSHRQALWDSPSDARTSSDLVMASAARRAHSADVEFIIECKFNSETNNRNEAYLQLARYARAVFAHQNYRLRVFGFSLCGSIVNFVFFDRSGLLHSRDIDLSQPEDANLFVRHIITLLTLPPSKFGYDTRFSFRKAEGRNAIETLFKFGDREPQVVSELLCYRKCCSGRATCVCALGDDVMKGIWRPENRPDEGETLSLFMGVFGVCQVKDRSHGIYDTRLTFAEDLESSPSTSFFYPHGKAKTVVGPPTSSFRSQSTSLVSAASHGPNLREEPVASGPIPINPTSRGVRIRSDILMPRGRSLFDARNSLHLLMAIHDAFLGIMAFTEAGKIHCDISAYNLLLINPNTHYTNSGWLNAPNWPANADKWDCNGLGVQRKPSGSCSTIQTNTGMCTCPRLRRVDKLGRGPLCVIHDTEFTINEDRKEDEVHSDRTGTPAFISAHLLDSYMSQTPVTRTFVHDAESLLWILIWVVAHRSLHDDRWEINDTASTMIQNLSKHNMNSLCLENRYLLSNPAELISRIRKMKNPLSKDLAGVIGDLAEFFDIYLYHAAPHPDAEVSEIDEEVDQGLGATETVQTITLRQLKLALHNQYVQESHSQTLNRLFNIINKHIASLWKKNTIPKMDDLYL